MKLLLLSLYAACACADVSHLARAGADVSHLARAGADVSHLARAGADVSHLARAGADVSHLARAGADVSHLARAGADVSHLARAGADVSHLARAGADVSHLARARAPAPVGIVSQQLDVAPDGAYQWSYEAEDGTKSGARGDLKDISAENPALSVQGESSYRSPEGEQVSLQYVADENGYQPQGSHIPTAPPIPDYIARALQYIIDHPPKPDN